MQCVNDNQLVLADTDAIYDQGTREKHFTFDRVFNEYTTTEDIFKEQIEPAIKNQLLKGYNVTCFAYGMTGAGKTHTMFGSQKVDGLADLCI